MALLAPEQAGAASLAEAHDCKPALRGGAGCFERPQRYMQQPAGVSIHAALISGTVRACPAMNGCVIFTLTCCMKLLVKQSESAVHVGSLGADHILRLCSGRVIRCSKLRPFADMSDPRCESVRVICTGGTEPACPDRSSCSNAVTAFYLRTQWPRSEMVMHKRITDILIFCGSTEVRRQAGRCGRVSS